MAKTNPFDVTTPGGGDDPKQGDDRIRELKAAIQEREDEDHYWEQIGDIVDEDNVGFHRKVTLLVRTKPTAKADAGIFYTKDVGDPAKAEAFYLDEDNNEVQITSGGSLFGELFRSGDMMLSKNTSPPSNWTDVSATYEGRFMRITSGTPLDTGGSNTHDHGAATGSHTLSVAQMPAHTHASRWYTGTGLSAPSSGADGESSGRVDTTTSAGSGSGHTHTITSVNNIPTYVELRLFQKD